MRRTVLAPAGLWDAFLEHADHRDLQRIAEEAHRRSLYWHAFRLYRRAAEVGDPFALGQAVQLLQEAGRVDEAIGWLQTRAEAGDSYAVGRAAELLEEAGRADEAISWYKRAAQAGNPDALLRATGLLEEAGRADETISWLQTHAEAGNPYALGQVVRLLEKAGRVDEAMSWLQTRAAGPFALAWIHRSANGVAGFLMRPRARRVDARVE